MNSLYNKGLQDIFIIFALLAVNILLFNNVYASTEQDNNSIKDTSKIAGNLEIPTTIFTDKNMIFSYSHGLRVINKNEIRKVLKSAKMGASIIASPALLEFARINGIESIGRVLPDQSVKKISIYIKQFMPKNEMPEMLVFVREGSHNVKTSLAKMITDKSTLNQFIKQYNFELVFPGMFMDFTSIVKNTQQMQFNT